MKYLAVLGRQPEISAAELEALFGEVRFVGSKLASFESDFLPNIGRLGGTLKLAEPLTASPLAFLRNLPAGKIVLGLSDFSKGISPRGASEKALKLKKILVRHGRSVRVIPNRTAVLSTATTFHNRLGKSSGREELIFDGENWWRVIAVQNINLYTGRDQKRPARDAKVGMLPPKLAQILINLCGDLPAGAVVLDPFCGTGVVLQESLLMKYRPYGTDLSERMVEYSKKNLQWLITRPWSQKIIGEEGKTSFLVEQGDARSFCWKKPIDAVVGEVFLGPPMSVAPTEMKLKTVKQECKDIVLGCLKNLSGQITADTSVVLAIPAWLRSNGEYAKMNLLDEATQLGYNVRKFKTASQQDLLYHRDGQIVAREIIVLRKS